MIVMTMAVMMTMIMLMMLILKDNYQDESVNNINDEIDFE